MNRRGREVMLNPVCGLATLHEAGHNAEMTGGRVRVERLRLVPGGLPYKPRQSRKVSQPWECRVCETDIGVRTRALMKIRLGAQEDGNLRITGGTDHWACATCLARGKLTLQTA